mmetsp:Transcript_32702/g.56893  ORF Transcript_32702/g.56893 Transcript_32702/m.56893 type:complete len:334 (+) Transcript_32702:5508-6509(+)
MSDSLIGQFQADYQTLTDWQPKLDLHAVYVALGTRHNLVVDVSLESILCFASKVCAAQKAGMITAEQRKDIEFSSFTGKIGEAKSKLGALCGGGVENSIVENSRLKAAEKPKAVEEAKAAERSRAKVKLLEDARRAELIRKLEQEWEDHEKKQIEKDAKLAQELQKALDIEAAQEQPKITNFCQACFRAIDDSNLVTLDNCSHNYHESCIAYHLETQIESHQHPVTCPSKSCFTMLNTEEVRRVVSYQMFSVYQSNELMKLNIPFRCPNCSKCMSVQRTMIYFNCPFCKYHYCLYCRVPYHYGMNCIQYKQRFPRYEDASYKPVNYSCERKGG